MKYRKNGRNVDTTFLSRELPSNTSKSKFGDSERNLNVLWFQIYG